MSIKDKRKKIQKRLSKLKKIERKDKKKTRTKHKGSKTNNLYQEYVYQKKNRTASYLLVLLIIVLLAAIGFIVYFFIIKPKLDNKTEAKPKCVKNEVEDCQMNKYLDKEKCECLPCENPNPTCKTNEYYDPNNLPYCRNSNEYITDKDGNKKKMYSCQPCPTCPDGKKVNQCGGGEYDINNLSNKDKSCVRPNTDDNSGGSKKVLRGGTIAVIVICCIIVLSILIWGFINLKKERQNKLDNPKIQNVRPTNNENHDIKNNHNHNNNHNNNHNIRRKRLIRLATENKNNNVINHNKMAVAYDNPIIPFFLGKSKNISRLYKKDILKIKI